jgi:phosphoserine aminotransferase
MTRVFNFSAGPAALPEPVLRQAAEEMLDWHGSGMSVMEMSHRGKEFISIHAEAESLLRELLAVPSNYKVLFMQGGAIGENAIVPMNMLRGKTAADYIDTGEWSKKSIKEAGKYCTVNVAASAKAGGYTSIPPRDSWKLDPNAAYVHICSNETIGGVEYHWTPDVGSVPLVADMSSNILSGPVDVSKYGLIYGGAQKNIGPAGLTIVIVRDDLIGQALPITPSAFDYKQQAENDSMLNTPPTYGIYIAGLVFRWIKAQGGLQAMAAHNQAKAALLYDYLDSTSFLRQPGGQGRPFADERALQAEGRVAGRRLPEGCRRAAHAAAQGPPLRGRHARVDLQRHAGRRREGPRRLHEGIRGEAWLRRSACTSWC